MHMNSQPPLKGGLFRQVTYLCLIFCGNKYELLYVQLQAICLNGAVQEAL